MMPNQFNNLNLVTCSDSELKNLVRETLPIAIVFVKASQRLLAEENKPSQSPCEKCDKAGTCQEICELLESQLPGAYSGSSILNNTYGDHIDRVLVEEEHDEVRPNSSKSTALNFKKIPISDPQYSRYQNCEGIFKEKQREVIEMRYRQGMKIKEIAEKLGLGLGTIGDRLRRAKANMEEHYKKLRKERLEHVSTRKNT